MADVDELERALLARWDHDTLLVYADCLQARGDPRGELIALDRELAERGYAPELATRRRKRLYEWLGGSVVCGRPWHEAGFRDGFVTDFMVTHDRNASTTDYLRGLFASPAGPYVRGLTIDVRSPTDLQAAFAFLCREPRRWLERIELRVVTRGAPLSDRLVAAVIAATPRLHTLTVHGERALLAFAHPSVRRVITESPLLSLVHTIPAVDALDLQLADPDEDEAPPVSLAELRTLRRLDLARNEPHYPPATPPNVDIYPFARALSLPGLAVLRLPSLRAPHQAELVRSILDEHPHLTIEIARTYQLHDAPVAALRAAPHPRLRLPAPRPWPPVDTLSSREALTITIPTEEHGDDVSLTRLTELLEDQFDDLPPAAQAAWREVWAFLADLPWEDHHGREVTRPFPATTLLAALEPVDDVILYSGSAGHWAQLAEKLRAAELPPDATVEIRRYWGW